MDSARYSTRGATKVTVSLACLENKPDWQNLMGRKSSIAVDYRKLWTNGSRPKSTEVQIWTIFDAPSPSRKRNEPTTSLASLPIRI